MKHTILTLLTILACTTMLAQTEFDNVPWQEITLDCSSLTSSAHPRLFLTDDDFNILKEKAGKPGYMADLHRLMMKLADESLGISKPLQYKKDESGKRILKISTEALRRIASLSYAYRFTGKKAYLTKTIWYLDTVCDFPDWNASHFLDPSEMAMGVSIGYDWLYRKLPRKTKSKIEDRLRRFAMEEAAHGQGQHIFKRSGNWNQVCNACMTAAAIATFECNPDLSYEIIRRGIESNIPAAKAIYYPDGAFPEGPGYWDMGTCYQQYLILLWEGAFGSDFGFSKIEGWSESGMYKAFTRNASGHVFNYSDSSDTMVPSPGIWYFAWKFGKPDILCDELKFLDSDKYISDRRLLLAVIMASRIESDEIGQPKERLFVARGKNHVLMAKSGWGEEDLYLGLKGGTASAGHSHLDAGSFVFDAFGSRWAADYYLREYTRYEKLVKELGLPVKEFSNVRQGSFRWELFIYNNRQHTTLTINGHDHTAAGFAPITRTWDTPEKIGGELDMHEIFQGDLKDARRSASIIEGSWLEVKDSLAAIQDKKAHVRWTLITPAELQIYDDRIELSDGVTTMVLSSDAPGATYRKWSSDPKDYPSRTAYAERKLKDHNICGFEFDLKAGEVLTITTTIKKK